MPEYSCEGAESDTSGCRLVAAVERLAVLVFTAEYLLRLVSSPADPAHGGGRLAPVRFVFSFYSAVDLLAIVPFYVADALPGGWMDQHDSYFRMLRLLRLLKLDQCAAACHTATLPHCSPATLTAAPPQARPVRSSLPRDRQVTATQPPRNRRAASRLVAVSWLRDGAGGATATPPRSRRERAQVRALHHAA